MTVLLLNAFASWIAAGLLVAGVQLWINATESRGGDTTDLGFAFLAAVPLLLPVPVNASFIAGANLMPGSGAGSPLSLVASTAAPVAVAVGIALLWRRGESPAAA